MRWVLAIWLGLCVCVAGCTAPSNRVAEQSIQLADQHTSKIVLNLHDKAWQATLNAAAARIEKAFDAGDKAGAAVALEEAANKFGELEWLSIQYERSRSALRLAKQYIWSERGWWDVAKESWAEAVASTQPVED